MIYFAAQSQFIMQFILGYYHYLEHGTFFADKRGYLSNAEEIYKTLKSEGVSHLAIASSSSIQKKTWKRLFYSKQLESMPIVEVLKGKKSDFLALSNDCKHIVYASKNAQPSKMKVSETLLQDATSSIEKLHNSTDGPSSELSYAYYYKSAYNDLHKQPDLYPEAYMNYVEAKKIQAILAVETAISVTKRELLDVFGDKKNSKAISYSQRLATIGDELLYTVFR